MKNNVVRYIEGAHDAEKVRAFFDSIDEDFYPHVSQRVGQLEQYLAKPLDQGRITLFERDQVVVGALAYWVENATAMAEIVGVAETYRKTPIPYRLLEYAVQVEAKNKEVKRVRADTWSTNVDQRNVLETLGFKIKEIVEGDLVPDRTTVRYEADFNDIRDFFGIESSQE